MKIRPMQQIADHIVGSRPILWGILAVIDEEIKALKWKLWHGQVDRAICALEKIIVDMDKLGRQGDLSAARLNSLGQQLLTYIRSNRTALVDYGARYRAGRRIRPAWRNPRSIPWLRKGWSKASKCAGPPRALISCSRSERRW
jgi:hypothetical protein